MTRETKVGLLVGMGVILLIGIIVSDHLSDVHQQKPARLIDSADGAQRSIMNGLPDLARTGATGRPRAASPGPAGPAISPTPPTDPPWSTGPDDGPPAPGHGLPQAQRLADTAGAGAGAGAEDAAQSGRRDAPVEPVGRTTASEDSSRIEQFEQGGRIVRRDLASGHYAQPSPTPTRSSDTIYYVKRGENLFSIAKTHYGIGEYWRIIAEANPKVVRPGGHVRVNDRLIIPGSADEFSLDDRVLAIGQEHARRIDTLGLTPGIPPRFSDDQSVASGSIQVVSGDTLSSLAARYLGSSRQWRSLIEANREQLDRPEELMVGMTLRLPVAWRAGRTPTAPPSVQRRFLARSYTVQSGDTLYRIGAETLGDRNRWRELFEANRDKLDNPHTLRVGQRLRIP